MSAPSMQDRVAVLSGEARVTLFHFDEIWPCIDQSKAMAHLFDALTGNIVILYKLAMFRRKFSCCVRRFKLKIH